MKIEFDTIDELKELILFLGGLSVNGQADDHQNTNAERQKRYRENKKRNETVTNVTETVTRNVTNVTLSQEERENEKEEEKERSKEKEEEKVKEKEELINICAAPKSEKPKSKRSKDRDRGELKQYGIAKNVLLSDEEYESLKKTVGNSLDSLIDDLSVYLGKTPKYGEQYPDHYFDLLSWHRKDEKDKQKQQNSPPMQCQPRFASQQKSVNEYPDIYTRLKAEGKI